ncbi:hypothetical protein CEP51_016560 [Fusarium floridanum]|uniref:Zn(2)-C6 fungal-type domain-containing protein n=1 Tax=Fusarium floridanum TaxID=1325733 RepID=A0A428NLL6_9HYPO|nr:hypothetical protein CEP51_016560 [Fusarium floridanum]
MADKQIPSTASASASNTAPTHTSNAGRKRRSCLMCSKRKVKCDKQKPCTSCVKAGNECVFPASIANRAQVGMAPEIFEMLQRLEKAVQTLEPKESETAEASLPSNQFSDGDGQTEPLQPVVPTAAQEGAASEIQPEPYIQESSTGAEHQAEGQEATGKTPSAVSSRSESPGKIVRDHGKDIYVRRWFWDDGSTEISSSSQSDTDDNDAHQDQSDMQRSSTGRCPGTLANPKEQVMQILVAQKMHLWGIYKERVEPLTKLLHLPSLEQAVLGWHSPSSADGMQCNLLATYYGAVTSLSEEECVVIFGNGQAHVLSHLREELEALFASALLIHTGDIRPLQALALYLVFLQHHEPRLSWKLSGLAVRLAQTFGLHREDSFVGLSIYEVEMRRRLWWQIAILDAPSAEAYSGEYNLLEMSSSDTNPPRNLDDAQIYPAMAEYPPEARRITEMTFTLARCQITSMYRCMADSRRLCGATGKAYAELTPQERADWVEACESNFSERFLRECSPTNAFHWTTVIFTRMLFHKARLHGCNPLHDARTMPEATRERLFLVAVEVMELNYKLRTDPRTRPWLWLFSSYTQWHAFSLVLVWLQMDPFCRYSRRAWEAVEKAIVLRWEHPASLLNGRKPQQWRSIIRLLEKARSARREALSKRARRGSRNANDLRRASFRGSVASSSSAVPVMHTSSATASYPRQETQPQQPHGPQQQPPIRSVEPNAAGPPQATTDVSSLPLQLTDLIQSPWRQAYANTMPDFSMGGIPDPLPDPDQMMIDGQFSVDDFGGVQDFSFLDDIF